MTYDRLRFLLGMMKYRVKAAVLVALTLIGLGLTCDFLGAGSASASSFKFEETFGSVSKPSFAASSALAVDPGSGDLLVVDTTAKTINRFNSDGTPDEFSALGSNVIDGLAGGADETPQGGLGFGFGNPREVQVAIDNSSTATDGNIYVTQPRTPFKLITVFADDGTFLSQLTASSEGPFGIVPGVAVDSTGAIYVTDSISEGRIHKYFGGTNTANFPHPSFGHVVSGAGPTASFIFASEFGSTVRKLDSTTGEVKYVVDPGASIALTVDPVSGSLFSTTGSEVKEFDVSGATEAQLLGSFSPGSAISGIAVDGSVGLIYVAREGQAELEVWERVTVPEAVTKPATDVTDSSATLNGEVNPNGAPLTTCFFEWGTTTVYGNIAECDEPDAGEVGEGNSPVAVHADLEELQAGTTYHLRLVAENAEGTSEGGGDETFKTLGPALKDQAVSGVTTSSAKITAQLNPNAEESGFFVEYLDEATYLVNPPAERFLGATQVPVPEREVPAEVSGTGFQPIVQQLSDLTPQTTYHFRIVASNPSGTAIGPDMAFTTFALPTTELPDDRKYEMISPAQKSGEVIPPEPVASLSESCSECLPGINVPTLPMQAAPDGESVLYEGQPFFAGLAGGPNEYVSRRGSAEWSLQSLSTPAMTGRYEAISADLSQAVFAQATPALSPEAPTRGTEAFPNLYLRDEGGSFEPLVTVEPPERQPFEFRIAYEGANAGTALTPELSHLIFEANDALTPEAPEVGTGSCPDTQCNLYEWAEGELRLVNLRPDESTSTSAVLGSGRLLAVNTPDYQAPNVDRAISGDGSRIFFSEEASGQVFVRVDGTETLEIPGPGLCKASIPLPEDRVCFLTASADGSVVLLSDGQLYELSDSGPEEYVEGEDLTEGQGGFEGILGASEDLSHLYFVATSDLTDEAKNDNGEEAEPGELNLYAWEEGDVSFIGILAGSDNGFGVQSRFGTWKAARPDRTAQVSPDGEWLAFMSQARLTGYDNRRSGGGLCTGLSSSCREVFLYAADSGELSCASCNPSGQRPLGGANLSLLRPGSPGLPFPPNPQPGNLASEGEGRLFFESLDSLLPQDTNGGVQDLYQWEPEGVGSCETEGGCVSLISSGHGANDTMFLDSSADGDDVFLITREQLLPKDKDEQLDLYDARVNGGFEETLIGPCQGEACAGPLPPPPPQPSSASSTFSGPGNPPQNKPAKCKKGFVKKKGKCVKKKPKKGKGQRNRGR